MDAIKRFLRLSYPKHPSRSLVQLRLTFQSTYQTKAFHTAPSKCQENDLVFVRRGRDDGDLDDLIVVVFN